MTYNTNVPNASQSPGLFPAQANTNFSRLKVIIQGDHVFNDTAAATDGLHSQVTLINRTDPSSVPAGANSILYGKVASDGINDFWFYNSTVARQANWRELTGTASITTSFSNIVAVPADTYGYIFMYASIGVEGYYIQTGAFAANNSVCNAYSVALKFESGSGAQQIIRFGVPSDGASGLFIRGKNDQASKFTTTWTYKVYYRLI